MQTVEDYRIESVSGIRGKCQSREGCSFNASHYVIGNGKTFRACTLHALKLIMKQFTRKISGWKPDYRRDLIHYQSLVNYQKQGVNRRL